MTKRLFLATVAFSLFFATACSSSDDNNAAVAMLLNQGQGGSSVSSLTSSISGTSSDKFEYILEISENSTENSKTLTYMRLSEDKTISQLLTVKKTGSDYAFLFTHKDKNGSFTTSSWDSVGFIIDSNAKNLENPGKTVPDTTTFFVNGTLSSDTIAAIKECTSLKFVMADSNSVSPMVEVPFETRVLSKTKRFVE